MRESAMSTLQTMRTSTGLRANELAGVYRQFTNESIISHKFRLFFCQSQNREDYDICNGIFGTPKTSVVTSYALLPMHVFEMSLTDQ